VAGAACRWVPCNTALMDGSMWRHKKISSRSLQLTLKALTGHAGLSCVHVAKLLHYFLSTLLNYRLRVWQRAKKTMGASQSVTAARDSNKSLIVCSTSSPSCSSRGADCIEQSPLPLCPVATARPYRGAVCQVKAPCRLCTSLCRHSLLLNVAFREGGAAHRTEQQE
jgi:hypothetical protein